MLPSFRKTRGWPVRSNLQVMYRTALAVSHTLDIDQLLQRIMELIFEWVEADRGCIMLMDPTSKALQPKVRRTREGRPRRRTHHDQQDDSRLRDRAQRRRADQRRPAGRALGPGGSIVQMGVREAICVPMQGRYDVVGAIYIDTSTSAQQLIQQGGAEQVHRRPPEADDRHRPPGRAGRRGHPLLLRHGPGRAAGGRRPNHRHALAPHQEHPAGHPRRQLSDRDGPEGPRRGGRSARAGTSSSGTRTASPPW